MYRLYHKIPKGLEPIADIFKQVCHFMISDEKKPFDLNILEMLETLMVVFLQQITAEGTMLVKQAEQDHNSQV